MLYCCFAYLCWSWWLNHHRTSHPRKPIRITTTSTTSQPVRHRITSIRIPRIKLILVLGFITSISSNPWPCFPRPLPIQIMTSSVIKGGNKVVSPSDDANLLIYLLVLHFSRNRIFHWRARVDRFQKGGVPEFGRTKAHKGHYDFVVFVVVTNVCFFGKDFRMRDWLQREPEKVLARGAVFGVFHHVQKYLLCFLQIEAHELKRFHAGDI